MGNKAVVNAEWDSGQLVAYDVTGKPYDSLLLPASRPTSCVLDGSDGCTLYVTSARQGLSEEEIQREPVAGGVFAIEIDFPSLQIDQR